MIIQCDKCSTKFKLDESKVTGKGIRVRCTKCQNVFAVLPPDAPAEAAPPPAPAAPDEGFGFDTRAQDDATGGEGRDTGAGADFGFDAGAGSDAGAAGSEGADAGASGGENDFTGFDVSAPTGQDASSEPSLGGQDFDFGAPPEGGIGSDEQQVAGGTNEWSFDAAGGSAPDFDAGGGADNHDAFGGGAGFELNDNQSEPPGEPPAYGGDDMNAPPPHEEPFIPPAPSAPAGDDWQIGGADEDGGAGGSDAGETEFDGGAREDAQASAAESSGPASEPNAFNAGMSDEDFSAQLAKSMEDESKSAVEGDNAAHGQTGQGASSKSSKLLPIIILILLLLAAGWYFGIRGGSEPQVAVQTVDITSIDGRYEQTDALGSFFVIEAKIKNITASPQPVKAVTGVIYDAKGKQLASMPGRVMSGADIKTLTKEDLAKAGKTGAVGTIPPKGTLPVVVIFTKPPEGMAEYSVEITP